MIATNITEITSEEAIKILCISTRKNYLKKYILSIVLMVCGIPVTLVGYFNDQTFQFTMGTLFIAISIVYTIINSISLVKIPKYVMSQNEDICKNGVIYEYKFKEQSINVVCKSANKTNKLNYEYSDVKKIVEEEDKYILYLKEYMILYVYKSGFENKKMEEFFVINLQKNKKKIKFLKN
ncbi:MAG: YcxB family protein [Anaeroplasma sp.]